MELEFNVFASFVGVVSFFLNHFPTHSVGKWLKKLCFAVMFAFKSEAKSD